ncbi:hypothetical protein N836_22535 [Leptolyngbya sp. Heron Island J]|uniref:hypothetical protein n=1 Tax=Leptolyngbya sp. Heron Island J TaxID=1385935 RepID=UPI0003B9B90C|nr:hypothetical protein [Leptolyngbya sp. Heron Island J]ESA33172.1 hypothetical protein N836_22535 [Leptolyngbya sp. Heron Island J]
MSRLSRGNQLYWLIFLPLAFAGFFIHYHFWQTPATELQGHDMYYIWLEGKRILAGENPYARILAGNLRENDKYATYFPIAYLLSALVQKLGFLEYRDWLYFWRPLSLLCHMGIVGLTLQYFQKRGVLLLGIAASTVILLGRWSIYIVRVHHLEFAAIVFLVFSLALLSKKTPLALLLFSISLGIKQIAVFLLPLYLVYLWKKRDRYAKNCLIGLLIIVSVPLVTSLPFILWNAEGFFKSVLFSATRLGDLHISGAPSIDVIFAVDYPWLVGLRAKLLMLLLMALVYLSFWKERVGVFTASTLVMMAFLYFNSVLFLQYFIWPLCLALFAMVEGKRARG